MFFVPLSISFVTSNVKLIKSPPATIVLAILELVTSRVYASSDLVDIYFSTTLCFIFLLLFVSVTASASLEVSSDS
jgi:anaerobic C4-dicarboxylate transporter